MAVNMSTISALDSFRLDGKRALITGAASGIGMATAELFAEAGASVVLVDIDQERLAKAAGPLKGSSAEVCDITNERDVEELMARTGPVDVLVNCAGIGLVGTAEETAQADWQRLFRVNVEGTFLMIKAALPGLKQRKGSILNIGSVAGIVGVRRRFAYCATKGAVIAMTRQIAADYPTEVRCNCIAPGTVESPFVEGYLEKFHSHEKEKVRAELHQRQPIGRMGRPDEIAKLALYVSSSAAEFMNGSVLTIDGGWTAV
jgi:NAD(P)-dependent dehydrogenase (short-subunit alcohol dehydrogenase family)